MLVAVCTLLASDRWRSVLASAYAKATDEDGGSEPTVTSSEALQGYVFTAKSSALVKLHCIRQKSEHPGLCSALSRPSMENGSCRLISEWRTSIQWRLLEIGLHREELFQCLSPDIQWLCPHTTGVWWAPF